MGHYNDAQPEASVAKSRIRVDRRIDIHSLSRKNLEATTKDPTHCGVGWAKRSVFTQGAAMHHQRISR